MNIAEVKLDLFRQIDSLPEEVVFEIQKPIIEILSQALKNKIEKKTHPRIRKRILKPFQVDKIFITGRENLNER
jgi:hypothetical protein